MKLNYDLNDVDSLEEFVAILKKLEVQRIVLDKKDNVLELEFVKVDYELRGLK